MSGDDRDRDERPRLSWSEVDKLRDKARTRRDDSGSRGPASDPRSRAATQSYLKKLDRTLFAGGARRDAGTRLGDAVREALGTPGLADACRAYHAELGAPSDPALLAAFLDAPDREIQLVALRALGPGPARVALSAGLRSQLRTLAAGSDDELAEAAETALVDA
jgi:hypothetical protein